MGFIGESEEGDGIIWYEWRGRWDYYVKNDSGDGIIR